MNSTSIMQQYILIKPSHLQTRNIHEFQALRSLENNQNLLQNVTHMHVHGSNNIPVTEAKKHGEKCSGKQPKVSSMVRRNARERRRVKMINMGYETLRTHIPTGGENRKLSKVDTLRAAVNYIKQLQLLLDATEPANGSKDSNSISAPSGTQTPASARATSNSSTLSPTLTEDISDDEENDENMLMEEESPDFDANVNISLGSGGMSASQIVHSASNTTSLNTGLPSSLENNVQTIWTSMQHSSFPMTTVPMKMTFSPSVQPVMTLSPLCSGPAPSMVRNNNASGNPVTTSNSEFPGHQGVPAAPAAAVAATFPSNLNSRNFLKEEKVFVDIAEWLCKTNSLHNGQIKLEDLES